MKKLMPVILVIIILLIGGVVFAQKMNNKGPKTTSAPAPEQNSTVEKIPENALDVTVTPDAKITKFTLGIKGLKSKGYKSFEYEVSYDADSTEEPGQTVTQGSASKEPTAVTDNSFSREILFGTCSKNICKYDKNVHNLKIVLRLTDDQGKVKLWEKQFPLD